MSVYSYIASERHSGQVRRGQLSADSPVQVRTALRRMGLSPVRVTEHSSPRADRASALTGLTVRFRRDRRRARLVEFYENFAALLESGMPLTESLDLLSVSSRRQTRHRAGAAPPFSVVARSVADSIRQGQSLAESMGRHGDWFGPIDVALIRSGEQSGELSRVVSDLAAHHERADELKGRLAGALAYPALLLAFGLGVVLFLTTKTLPQLAGVLTDSDVPLPGATAALLALGRFITGYWPWITLALLITAIVVTIAARSPRLAAAQLRIPLLGPAQMRSQVGAASLLVARLLDCGLPLTEALLLASPTISNPALRRAYEQLRDSLIAGGSLGDMGRASATNGTPSAQRGGLFEPMYLRVLEIGEQRGDLSAALHRIGQRYRASARRHIDRLAAALEPIAILVMAAMIGFVVYAAIIPMTRLGQAL